MTSFFSKFSSSTTKPKEPEKKGEINELKEALGDPNIDKDQDKKKELLQKVINYATMGIDTTKLFDKVILLVNTKDLIQKKMVYQYVTHHSHLNQDLALLAINTLSKDCRDESPLVRGLALRCLSSFRIAKLVEFLLPLVKEGLNDPNSYVKKTAVTAVVKMNRISPDVVKNEKFVERLYDLIRDKDVNVVVNCITALNEILAESGGMVVPKKLIYYLLNRLREYNEWQLCIILKQLIRYTPGSQNEIFDIMNLLDPFLSLANTAVLLAISNVFLQFTYQYPKIHQKVFRRLKDPLLLAFATSTSEISYSILLHLKFLIHKSPALFASNYRDFFIKHNEATYIKHHKLEILGIIATEESVKDIMEELSYYVTVVDVDEETSRRAIRTLGEISVRISSATESSITFLLEFLETRAEHIASETFIVMKDILRKYNDEDFCRIFLPVIAKKWRAVNDPNATVAFLWILGEFGEMIDSAPYIIETYIDEYSSEHPSVKMEILSSSMKLFLKRAPEMQKMLGRLFEKSVVDTTHVDVHDRALYYYRLLKTNIEAAKKIILVKKNLITNFSEDDSLEFKEKLFTEFDTLSIPFNQPSDKFIIKGVPILGETEFLDDEKEVKEEEQEEEEVEEEEEEEEEEEMIQMNRESLLHSGVQKYDPFDTNQEMKSKPIQSSPQQIQVFTLRKQPQVLNPKEYQQIWKSVTNSKTINSKSKSGDQVEEKLASKGILCMASTKNSNPMKFYFYGQTEKGTYYLVETKITPNTGETSCLFKSNSTDEKEWSNFIDLMMNSL